MKKVTKNPKVTFGMYSLRWRSAKSIFRWTPPFVALDDGVALAAMLEMAKECPDLQNKYLCCVGKWDPAKGLLVGCKPRIVRSPKKEEVNHE